MHLQGTGVCAHLYGSRARGNARRFSDIDIALSAGNRPVPAAVLAALAESLEESRIPYIEAVAIQNYEKLHLYAPLLQAVPKRIQEHLQSSP